MSPVEGRVVCSTMRIRKGEKLRGVDAAEAAATRTGPLATKRFEVGEGDLGVPTRNGATSAAKKGCRASGGCGSGTAACEVIVVNEPPNEEDVDTEHEYVASNAGEATGVALLVDPGRECTLATRMGTVSLGLPASGNDAELSRGVLGHPSERIIEPATKRCGGRQITLSSCVAAGQKEKLSF